MSDWPAFISWYLAVSAAGLLALPLAARLFRRLPDRGYALARPLGLLAAGYLFWLLGSLGFLRNDAPSVAVAAGLMLAAGLAWLGRAGRAELRAWLRGQLGYIAAVEIVFLASLALWTWVRAHNPEVLGTEKPMELMFINSILRSPGFPPHDAWLAGHAISYYYFGYVLVAALVQVTGVASASAFNLAVALVFALTVTGSLGVAVNLIALAAGRGNGPAGQEDGSAERSPGAGGAGPGGWNLVRVFWPALIAPLLVALAGNFYGVVRLTHAQGWLRGLELPAVYYDFGDPASGRAPGARAGLVNVWSWLDLKGAEAGPAGPAGEGFNWDPGFWWWFNGARITHDRDLLGQETEAITEVPAFSFVLGDLHPHVLALPFVFLAIALSLHWLLWAAGLAAQTTLPGGGQAGPGRWLAARLLRPAVPELVLTALVLGGLAFLNTWDFPIYWFLVGAGLAAGLGLAVGWDGLLGPSEDLPTPGWRVAAVFASALVVLGVGLYLPFYLTFQSQAGGILPNLIYPTRLQQTVVMFGPVLLPAGLYVLWLARRAGPALDRGTAWRSGGGLLAGLLLTVAAIAAAAWFNPALASFVDGFIAPLSRGEAAGLLLQRRLIDSLTSLAGAALIGLCVGLAAGALRRPAGGPAASAPVLFTLLLTLTGGLLLLGPEFLYLRDNFGTRMNTIFKFYFQAWVLWGLAGAFGLWHIGRRARPRAAAAARLVCGLAAVAGLLYTLPAVWSRTNGFAGPATLDGLAYFAQQYPDDWAAIQWLGRNAAGAPVIAEGIGGQYWIEGRFSRISMATGLPTVMGWPGHEAQWRGRAFDQVAEREGQIALLYQTRDWAAAREVLNRYNIEYVVVSGLERQKYGPIFQAKFDAFMRPVFSAGDLTLYQRMAAGP